MTTTTAPATLTDLFRNYLAVRGEGGQDRAPIGDVLAARRAVTARLRQVAAAQRAVVAPSSFTITESEKGHRDYVSTTADYQRSHSRLVNMGYTCDRQTYDDADNITAGYFRHTINSDMSAQIVAA